MLELLLYLAAALAGAIVAAVAIAAAPVLPALAIIAAIVTIERVRCGLARLDWRRLAIGAAIVGGAAWLICWPG